MAKKSPLTDAPADVRRSREDAGDGRKHRKRLERELAALGSAEAKLVRQLAKIRAKATEIEGRFKTLEGSAEVEPDLVPAPPSTLGPFGYCLRERKSVRITEPVAVTYPSGRAAMRGTCPTCGARVVALAARPRTHL